MESAATASPIKPQIALKKELLLTYSCSKLVQEMHLFKLIFFIYA
jgi:hypothetical protein